VYIVIPAFSGDPALFSLAVWVLLYLWKMLNPVWKSPKKDTEANLRALSGIRA